MGITVRPRLTLNEMEAVMRYRKKQNNTLIIGDLHAPFIKEGYLEFCKETHKKHNCERVVFIGDVIDNHYSSYHESDPDGYGAAEELKRAKEQIKGFYKAFPEAYVCLGNHDILPNRKAFTGGISKSWIRDISDVLEVPGWNFAEEWIFDGVLYTHGVGRKAKQRCQHEFVSVVQGHYHSDTYLEMFVSDKTMLFALQIGCGIDRKAYAMAYGKHFKKPQINVGVVFENGRYPVIEPMKM